MKKVRSEFAVPMEGGSAPQKQTLYEMAFQQDKADFWVCRNESKTL